MNLLESLKKLERDIRVYESMLNREQVKVLLKLQETIAMIETKIAEVHNG